MWENIKWDLLKWRFNKTEISQETNFIRYKFHKTQILQETDFRTDFRNKCHKTQIQWDERQNEAENEEEIYRALYKHMKIKLFNNHIQKLCHIQHQ